MWRGRSLLLVSVLFAAVLRQPAPSRAWHADDLDLGLDHDLDLDLDHEHDDLDLDDDDFLRKGGIKRLRLPSRPRAARAGGAGDAAGDGAGNGVEGWDADLEKMLHAESPWMSGADGRESYEEFVRRFSSEAPGEEQDDWD